MDRRRIRRYARLLSATLALLTVGPMRAAGEDRVITGRVHDSQGKGITGATILGSQFRRLREPYVVRALTDANGDFSINVDPDAIAKDGRDLSVLWAYAPGHQFGTASVYQQIYKNSNEPVDIELQPPSDTSFIVFDPAGKPLEGAFVQPRHLLTPSAYEFPPAELIPMIRGQTDSEGRAHLPAVGRKGFRTVEVSSEEYGRQQLRLTDDETEPAEREIYLRHVGDLVGRFVSSDPKFAEGIRVVVESPSIFETEGMSGGYGECMSAADGKFRIDAVAAGDAGFYVMIDQSLPVRPRIPRSVAIVAGQTSSIDIPLESATPVRGLVRDEAGAPIADVLVHLDYGTRRQSDRVVTDENGRFQTYVLSGPVEQLVIGPPARLTQLESPATDKILVPRSREPFDLPPIDLTRCETVTGRIIDSNDRPVMDAKISGIYENRVVGFGASNDEGEFTLELPPGLPLTYFASIGDRKRSKAVVIQNDPLLLRVESEE